VGDREQGATKVGIMSTMQNYYLLFPFFPVRDLADMRKSIQDLLWLELRFVGEGFASLDPVAQIDPRQFEYLGEFDLVEQGEGAQ